MSGYASVSQVMSGMVRLVKDKSGYLMLFYVRPLCQDMKIYAWLEQVMSC
jgi:hypothetical protein